MDRGGGDVPERLAIARLDAAAAEYQAASRHNEALDCMEKALAVRVKLFGLRSPEVRRARRATCGDAPWGELRRDATVSRPF